MMRIDGLLERGRLEIDDIAPRLAAVNFGVHDDFFEDVCKIRAARRMWYQIMTDKYGAKAPRSLALRIQGLTCSHTVTYQQPLNNIVRNTLRATAAALAGVNALGTASYDEAISVPSEEAAINAIRTQQIVQHESGIADVVDPLGGSYFVESLTSEIEARAWDYLEKIEDHGGFMKVLESGWAQAEAGDGAREWERKIADMEWVWVGGNAFLMDEEALQVEAHKPNPHVWDEAMARLTQLREERDDQRVRDALDRLRETALGDENLMPAMMEAVQAEVTVGEVGDLWRDLYGVWKPPLPF
jgi:methylmalonyl-CoA mutase N-terminal domain/subunit